MPQDRRQFNRFDALLIVELSSRLDESRYFFGLTKNISFEGFVFESQNYDLEKGRVLEFRLKHPHKDISVKLTGKILWKRETGFECETGVKFIKVDSDARSKIFELVSTDKSLHQASSSISSPSMPVREAEPREQAGTGYRKNLEVPMSDTTDKPLFQKAEQPPSAQPDTGRLHQDVSHANKKPASHISLNEIKAPVGLPGRETEIASGIDAAENDNEPEKGRNILVAVSIFIIVTAGVFYGLVTGEIDDLAGYPISAIIQNIFSTESSRNTYTPSSGERNAVTEKNVYSGQSEEDIRDNIILSPVEIVMQPKQTDVTVAPPAPEEKPVAVPARKASIREIREAGLGKPSTTAREETVSPKASVQQSPAARGVTSMPAEKAANSELTRETSALAIKKIKHPNTLISQPPRPKERGRAESDLPAAKSEKRKTVTKTLGKSPSAQPAKNGNGNTITTDSSGEMQPLKKTVAKKSKNAGKNLSLSEKNAMTDEHKVAEKEHEGALSSGKAAVSTPDPGILKRFFTKYEEEFNDNRNGWDIFSVGAASADIRRGEYRISNLRKEGTLAVLHHAAFPHERGFIIEAYIRPDKLSPDCSFGLIFGAKDALNNFSFQTGPQSLFMIRQYADGVAKTLISGGTGIDISSSGEAYLLKIVNLDDKVAFFVQDNYLGAIERPDFAGNKIGFILEGASDISVERTRSYIKTGEIQGGRQLSK